MSVHLHVGNNHSSEASIYTVRKLIVSGTFKQTTTDILVRSMARIDERYSQHKTHLADITEMKQRSARLTAPKAKAKDSKT